MRRVRSATLLLVLCLLCLAVYRAGRLAYADHRYRYYTLDSVRRAIRLAPDRALYRTGLADLLERAGEDPRPPLRRAAALKPNDAGIRIRLGMEAEARGDFPEAERELLAAARVSRKYAPRWTLANFYFRRGEEGRFWRWTRRAFRISYGDRSQLLDLCWRMAPDAGTILRRAIPEQRPVRLAFVNYLFAHRELAAAEVQATVLAQGATAAETPRFLQFVDRLLSVPDFPAAVAVWNPLCARRLVPYPSLSARRGPALTNGDFAKPILSRGFDWRVPPVSGVFIRQTSPAGLRLTLGGDQPDGCEILQQYLPLHAGGNYALKYRYRSAPSVMSAEDFSSGLSWRVYGFREWTVLIGDSDPFASEGFHEECFRFQAPDEVTGGRLVLRHQRAQGHTRMEGTVLIEGVALEISR